MGSNPATPTDVGEAAPGSLDGLAARQSGLEESMTLQTRIPTRVVIGRITSIIGLSFTVAVGILLLLGGAWIAGCISLLLALPFVGLLRFVEYTAERGALRGSGS